MKKKISLLIIVLCLALAASALYLFTPSTLKYDCILAVNGRDYEASVRLKVPRYKLIMGNPEGTLEVKPAEAIEGWGPAFTGANGNIFNSLFIDKKFYEFQTHMSVFDTQAGVYNLFTWGTIYINHDVGFAACAGDTALPQDLSRLALALELTLDQDDPPVIMEICSAEGGKELLPYSQNAITHG
ncbi:MAG: hypothetical protein HFE94_08765 [Acutalibacter sp.]|nr:hypothetical protein [Acutalibacter sp.]